MRSLGLVLLMAFVFALVSSCGGKKEEKQAAPPEQSADQGEGEADEAECEVDDDCYGGTMCIDGKCTGTGRAGIYHNPREAVTPAAVKREVEKRMKQGEERTERGMNMGE